VSSTSQNRANRSRSVEGPKRILVEPHEASVVPPATSQTRASRSRIVDEHKTFLDEPHETSVVPRATSQIRTIRSRNVDGHKTFLDELHELSTEPPASVWTLPMRDIPRFKRLAENAGLHASAVAIGNQITEGSPHSGWLVLGGEERVVLLLKAELEGGRKGCGSVEQHGQKGSGSSLRAVVGGAVLGAISVFVALAFSI
jgi:hypothetical protein